MNHIFRERLKLIGIFLLIFSSLIQVGILWGYQSQGTPTGFFMRLFGANSSTVNSDTARRDLFVPYRLVVSNDQSHWILAENDDLYGQIWGEAKAYLQNIVQGSLSRQPGVFNWGDVITKKGYMIEFAATYEPELIKWFLGQTGVKADIPAISRMMIVPDSEDEASSDIFLCGDNDKSVVEYLADNNVWPKSFDDVTTELEKKTSYREYYTAKDVKIDRDSIANIDSGSKNDSGTVKWDISPDVLFVVGSPRYWPYYSIHTAVPQRIGKDNELAAILLGNEKDKYMEKGYTNDRVEFYNNENIYRVYSNGYLTYSYTPKANPSDRGNIGDALTIAYEFINSAGKILDAKGEIYLSGVEDKNPAYYSFKFDYKADGLPVFVNLSTKGSQDPVTSALTINVNAKQVLKCGWLLRDIEQGTKNSYNDRLMDLTAIYGKKITDMKIKDISVGYLINSNAGKTVEPSMILESMSDAGVQAVGMPAEGGAG